MRKVFVPILLIYLLIPLSASAQTYYVDATNGNDNNPGTSPSGAWKTWSKVRGTAFSAGDHIKFKRGETWDARSAWTLDDSGSSGNEIAIEDYGSGALPIWDGRDELKGRSWTNAGGNRWYCTETDHCYRVTLDGQDSYEALNVAGIDGTSYLWYYDEGNDRIYIYSTQNPNNEYTTIKAHLESTTAPLHIKGSHITIQNIRIYAGKFSLYFYNNAADLSNIWINNCDCWYGYGGIRATRTENYYCNNVTIENCDINAKTNFIDTTDVAYSAKACVGDGIGLKTKSTGWTISNNTFAGWGHTGVDFQGYSGNRALSNHVVEYNTFDGTGTIWFRAFGNQGPNGQCDGNIFRYNLIKNMTVRSQVGGTNSKVYYNLFYQSTEDGRAGGSNVAGGLLVDRIETGNYANNVQVYNNVFYDNFGHGLTLQEASNSLIKNNVFLENMREGSNLAIKVDDLGQGQGNVISYNCIYDSDTATTIDMDSKGTHTVAYADANHDEFSNNIVADPLFNDAANGDFTLQASSPCIDTGIDVGLSLDFEGAPVPQGSAPDIGAYEYAGEAICEPNTYYVDATNGDDNNNGRCTNTAWKTIGKVNNMSFTPGDNILFKRGEEWREQLNVPSPGSAGNPITFGAYGSGDKPIITGRGSIPGWDTAENWIEESSNLWYMPFGRDPRRMFLSDTEYIEAENKANVDSTYRWWYDSTNDRIYVYATNNPANFYSDVEGGSLSESADVTTVKIAFSKHYITLENLDVQGGYRSIAVVQSDYVIVDNCTIGKYACIGIEFSAAVGNPTTYGEVKNCIVDSGMSCASVAHRLDLGDGIRIGSNCQYFKVHDNTMRDWGHASIGVMGNYAGTSNCYNEFYDNTMDSFNTNYDRGIAVDGDAIGYVTANKFYRNKITNMTLVGIRMSGNANEFYYNIIDTVNPCPISGHHSRGITLWNYNQITVDNKIYNNVIYNTAEDGIWTDGTDGKPDIQGNLIRNNVIMNWGDGYYGIWTDDHVTILDNTWENNCLYKSGVSDVVYYGHDAADDYPHTIAEFNAENGTAGDIIGNNIGSDPLFRDVANNDFHLQFTSPCIDAGVDVGLTLDFEGNPVPQGNAPDIGAYEYAGGIPGDIDNDGDVDIEDLILVATNFGKTSGFDPESDVIPNSEIDIYDMVFIASRFT